MDSAVRAVTSSKRAPRACETCRARKVRCDVTRRQAPCTNCKLDNKTCTLPTSKRRHVGDRILGSSFLEGHGHNPRSPIRDAIIDFGDVSKSKAEHKSLDTLSVVGKGTFDVVDLSTNPPAILEGPSRGGNSAKDTGEPCSQPTLFSPYPSPTQTLLDYPHYHWMLPNYITPLPKVVADEELQYLNSKGAFDIPDIEARNELLRAYAKWIHAFSPMLDLEETLTAIFSNGQNGTISLLLFQSILFAATAYVPVDEGRETRKSLRKMFYDRARLLHDFDVEIDRLIICQSAILLSSWDGHQNSLRDSYHWIGVAALHANNIGLDNFDDDQGDPHRQRIRRKTWWTLLVRDRLLAVALRRPVQNKAVGLDVPMLHMVDFRPDSFVETLQKFLPRDDRTVSEMETMASMWMALAQLSAYIDRVLKIQYTAQKTSTGQGQSVISLLPRTKFANIPDLTALGQELQNWYGYLPTEAQQLDDDLDSHHDTEWIRIHRSLLAAYYSMTLMTLYRPLLNLEPKTPAELHLRQESIKTISQASKSITKIFTGLYADNLISYLPDTAISALEPAMATHLLNSTSTLPSIRDTSFQKFFLCWRILLQFKQTYYLADTTMSMLDAAAQKLKSPPDLKRLKEAAMSQLMDELAAAEEEDTEAFMAVPFVGVVGDQKIDRSDVAAGDWMPARTIDRESSTSLQLPPQEYDHIFEVPADFLKEQLTFDQLLSWDDLEGEPSKPVQDPLQNTGEEPSVSRFRYWR